MVAAGGGGGGGGGGGSGWWCWWSSLSHWRRQLEVVWSAGGGAVVVAAAAPAAARRCPVMVGGLVWKVTHHAARSASEGRGRMSPVNRDGGRMENEFAAAGRARRHSLLAAAPLAGRSLRWADRGAHRAQRRVSNHKLPLHAPPAGGGAVATNDVVAAAPAAAAAVAEPVVVVGGAAAAVVSAVPPSGGLPPALSPPAAAGGVAGAGAGAACAAASWYCQLSHAGCVMSSTDSIVRKRGSPSFTGSSEVALASTAHHLPCVVRYKNKMRSVSYLSVPRQQRYTV